MRSEGVELAIKRSSGFASKSAGAEARWRWRYAGRFSRSLQEGQLEVGAEDEEADLESTKCD
jgi:hypothetical protein